MWATSRPDDVAATEQRFTQVCREAGELGDLTALAQSMPKRMRLVIEKGGTAIKY